MPASPAPLDAALAALPALDADQLGALRAAIDARLAAEPERLLSEREAVRLLARGYSNKEIAARLRVSVKTVETYKARALEKLDARGRVDLVRYALRRGWLTEAVGPAPSARPD